MKRPILTGVILIVVGLCCFGGGEGSGALNIVGLVLFVAGIVVIVKKVKTPKQQIAVQTASSAANGLNPDVVGLDYRVDNVESVGKLNPDFDLSDAELIAAGKTSQRIYKYSFQGSTFSLEQEPDNPHDPKAIKVLANGVHIGYISRDQTGPVHRLIDSGGLRRVKGAMYGGRYKEYDAASGRFYTVDTPYEARITIYSI